LAKEDGTDRTLTINLTIEQEDIERIVKALDTQYPHTRAKQFEDSNYRRLADLFRQFLKKPSR